jgi:hypothetical protein
MRELAQHLARIFSACRHSRGSERPSINRYLPGVAPMPVPTPPPVPVVPGLPLPVLGPGRCVSAPAPVPGVATPPAPLVVPPPAPTPVPRPLPPPLPVEPAPAPPPAAPIPPPPPPAPVPPPAPPAPAPAPPPAPPCAATTPDSAITRAATTVFIRVLFITESSRQKQTRAVVLANPDAQAMYRQQTTPCSARLKRQLPCDNFQGNVGTLLGEVEHSWRALQVTLYKRRCA